MLTVDAWTQRPTDKGPSQKLTLSKLSSGEIKHNATTGCICKDDGDGTIFNKISF